MNFRDRFYKPALAILVLILFGGVSKMQSLLNQDRLTLGFTKLAPLENAPPVLAFTTVALGGFRGLIANALWIRASDLQENDKYFEMVQLSDWITKLEPHFIDVWRVQSWNMAYNISVKFKDFEDRWRWVERGIQLLRDEGLKYNPDAVPMYRDLSWLFQHKIGQNLDDAHMVYKLHWAQEMQNVLGGHPNFNELLNPQTPEARERLRKLREVYKMDPGIVQDVDRLYGPLDWRLPDAHAIYWAEVGRRNTRTNAKDQDTLRRSIFQTMQQACFRGGSLPPSVTNVTRQNFILWPNLDLVPTVNAAYERMITEETEIQKNMENAHKNFLKTAVYMLYADNRLKQAQYWFNYVTRKYPNANTKGQSLEDYAADQITEESADTDPTQATGIILGLVRREYLALIVDEDDKAESYDRLAKRIWAHYTAKVVGASNDRVALKPFPELRRLMLDRMLDPNAGYLSTESMAILRTKMNLQAPGAK